METDTWLRGSESSAWATLLITTSSNVLSHKASNRLINQSSNIMKSTWTQANALLTMKSRILSSKPVATARSSLQIFTNDQYLVELDKHGDMVKDYIIVFSWNWLIRKQLCNSYISNLTETSFHAGQVGLVMWHSIAMVIMLKYMIDGPYCRINSFYFFMDGGFLPYDTNMFSYWFASARQKRQCVQYQIVDHFMNQKRINLKNSSCKTSMHTRSCHRYLCIEKGWIKSQIRISNLL